MAEEQKENTGIFEVGAKSNKGGLSASVDYIFGKNLDEAVERFGADVVYNLFASDLTVRVQAQLRSCLDKYDNDNGTYPQVTMGEGGKRVIEQIAMTPEQVIDMAVQKASSWMPTIKAIEGGKKKDAATQILKKMESMSAEDKLAFIEELKRKAGLA